MNTAKAKLVLLPYIRSRNAFLDSIAIQPEVHPSSSDSRRLRLGCLLIAAPTEEQPITELLGGKSTKSGRIALRQLESRPRFKHFSACLP